MRDCVRLHCVNRLSQIPIVLFFYHIYSPYLSLFIHSLRLHGPARPCPASALEPFSCASPSACQPPAPSIQRRAAALNGLDLGNFKLQPPESRGQLAAVQHQPAVAVWLDAAQRAARVPADGAVRDLRVARERVLHDGLGVCRRRGTALLRAPAQWAVRLRFAAVVGERVWQRGARGGRVRGWCVRDVVWRVWSAWVCLAWLRAEKGGPVLGGWCLPMNLIMGW